MSVCYIAVMEYYPMPSLYKEDTPEESWEVVIDVTEIEKEGITITDLLSRL